MKIDKVELAWAAGLFEGEGCLSTKHSQSRLRTVYGCVAYLATTDQDVLLRFREIIGFGCIGSKKPQRPGYLVQHYWRVSNFEHFQALIALLFPWFGSRRRARALELLRMMRAYHAVTPGKGKYLRKAKAA